MENDAITQEIIGSAIRVHAALGPGLLESAYRVCLHQELAIRGLNVGVEIPVPVIYGGRQVDVGYRIDLLVEDRILVELPVHEAQVLSYLRLGGYPVGLLINFHVPLLRDGLRRLVNQVPRQPRPG